MEEGGLGAVFHTRPIFRPLLIREIILKYLQVFFFFTSRGRPASEVLIEMRIWWAAHHPRRCDCHLGSIEARKRMKNAPVVSSIKR